MKNLFSKTLAVLILSSCASAPAKRHALILEPLPGWAHDSLYAGTFLNIDQLMKDQSLSRLQAVEVQNYIRDDEDAALLSGKPFDFESSFQSALLKVKNGKTESGFSGVRIQKPEEYIVALDADETLLMQWYSAGQDNGFKDFDAMIDTAGPLKSYSNVKLVPGVEKFLFQLKADPNCKAIVVFSAKADAPALDILRKWKLKDGRSAIDFFDGVFTRNHLVLGKKALIPSKDLRILDPELRNVVLVDDNPARVFQQQLLKAQAKYDAQAHYEAAKNRELELVQYYSKLLDSALKEIQDSSQAAKRLKISFSQAFLPYSYSGQRILRAHPEQNRDFVRLHPELQEAAFIPAK